MKRFKVLSIDRVGRTHTRHTNTYAWAERLATSPLYQEREVWIIREEDNQILAHYSGFNQAEA